MFSEPRDNVIESDEGFSVELLGITGLVYQEAGKTFAVDSEVLAGPSGLAIYQQTIAQVHDDTREPVSRADRERIVANIQRAFAFRGYNIQII